VGGRGGLFVCRNELSRTGQGKARFGNGGEKKEKTKGHRESPKEEKHPHTQRPRPTNNKRTGKERGVWEGSDARTFPPGWKSRRGKRTGTFRVSANPQRGGIVMKGVTSYPVQKK